MSGEARAQAIEASGGRVWVAGKEPCTPGWSLHVLAFSLRTSEYLLEQLRTQAISWKELSASSEGLTTRPGQPPDSCRECFP